MFAKTLKPGRAEFPSTDVEEAQYRHNQGLMKEVPANSPPLTESIIYCGSHLLHGVALEVEGGKVKTNVEVNLGENSSTSNVFSKDFWNNFWYIEVFSNVRAF